MKHSSLSAAPQLYECVHLSLDDIEQEVRATAAAEQMTQTQRLIQTLHLIQDKRWGPTWGTPEHRRKSKKRFSYFIHTVDCPYSVYQQVILWVQAGELRQQKAVVLGYGLFGGGGCQMTFKCQNLLPLLLRHLQLTVDHLSFGVFIGHRAWRVGVVTKKRAKVGYGYFNCGNIHKTTFPHNMQNTYFVITISISIFRVG